MSSAIQLLDANGEIHQYITASNDSPKGLQHNTNGMMNMDNTTESNVSHTTTLQDRFKPLHSAVEAAFPQQKRDSLLNLLRFYSNEV